MPEASPLRANSGSHPDAHCPDCPFADRGDWVIYRDEYEALTGENRRLREALKWTVDWIGFCAEVPVPGEEQDEWERFEAAKELSR